MANNTIIHKRSAVPGKVPLGTDLVAGELAINTADGAVYTEKDNGDIIQVSNVTAGKNLITNGDMSIWQVGTTQTTDGYGSNDRWMHSHFSSTKTHERIPLNVTEAEMLNGSIYASRTTVSSSSAVDCYVSSTQKIDNVRRTANRTVTVSLWAKADTNRSILIECVQDFGTGGSPSAINTGDNQLILSLSSAWQKYTHTFEFDSIIGKTLGTDENSWAGLTFWYEAGTDYDTRLLSLGSQSGIFDIANVQMELGINSSEFEQVDPAQELIKCQRFYNQEVDGVIFNQDVVSGVRYYQTIDFPVEMRVNPVITPLSISAPAGFDDTTLTADGTKKTIRVGFLATLTGIQQITIGYTADARL